MIWTRDKLREGLIKIKQLKDKMSEWQELVCELDASLEKYRNILDHEDMVYMENEKNQLNALYQQSWKKVREIEHNLRKHWRPEC